MRGGQAFAGGVLGADPLQAMTLHTGCRWFEIMGSAPARLPKRIALPRENPQPCFACPGELQATDGRGEKGSLWYFDLWCFQITAVSLSLAGLGVGDALEYVSVSV